MPVKAIRITLPTKVFEFIESEVAKGYYASRSSMIVSILTDVMETTMERRRERDAEERARMETMQNG